MIHRVLGLKWTLLLGLAALAAAAPMSVFLLGPADEELPRDETPVSATPTRDLTAQERTALAKALSPGLNDPGSVQWRWLPLSTQTFDRGRGRYCGYLDAKDSFGKYLGFQPFLAAVATRKGQIATGQLALLATDDEALATVKRMCSEAGYTIP